MTRDQLGALAQTFLDHLDSQMTVFKISLSSHWHVDHLCFRTGSEQSYQRHKELFSRLGTLLCESPVNGRLISTFKLFEPLQWKSFQVDLIELPAPKPQRPSQEGFEHIEVVIDCPFDEIKRLYSECSFNEAGLAKDFNQELEIELSGCAIKFHHLSLESVVCLETNHKIFQVLTQHQILKLLKKYNPLIAGTFPLGISNLESDVDILLSGSNLSEIAKTIKSHFGDLSEFFLTMKVVEEEPTVLARFVIDEVKIELFAQKIPSVSQAAYKHFLVEERLLKYGKDSLKKKILSLRNHGLKTEPAFGQALGLRTNPYYELLNLQKLSESELKDRFSF